LQRQLQKNGKEDIHFFSSVKYSYRLFGILDVSSVNKRLLRRSRLWLLSLRV